MIFKIIISDLIDVIVVVIGYFKNEVDCVI